MRAGMFPWPGRASWIVLILSLGLWWLAACDESPSYEDGLRQGYHRGYNKGSLNMVEEIKKQAIETRAKLRKPMQGRLLVLAVVAAVATLFGAKWADAARQYLASRFKVPLAAQAWFATGLYMAAAGGLMWYALAQCGFAASIPAALLVAGSIIPFLDYRTALLAGDAQRRRSAFNKCKSLLLLALVMLIVMLILSDQGFLGIQIGRVDPRPFFF